MNRYLYYLLYAAALLLSARVHAQTPSTGSNRVVAGVVKDEAEGLAGATIYEKGIKGNGASADVNGRFRIVLRGSSNTLIVQALGHLQKEVPVSGTGELTIVLAKSSSDLDEVVVAYSRQKKVTLTGAVSTVSGMDIRQNPSASLQNALVGRLPGFFSQQRSGQPGADGAAFYIRGVNTFTDGNTSPIVLVDDIEFTYDQFARIDPNEIESVTILKDAATTAVYGVKGANGVVLVTTRRGKVGKPQVSVRSEITATQPTILPKYLDAYQTASLYNQARVNDGNTPYFSDKDLALYQNGQDPYGHPNNNWRDILFRKFSQQWRNNLDVSGGTERVKYFISVGYLWQNGILNNFGKESDVNSNFYYRRYNYRSNLDVKVTGTTNLRLDLYGNVGETNQPYLNSANGITDVTAVFWEYGSFLTLSPYAYPIHNPNGTYGYSYKQPDRYNVGNIVERLALGGYKRNFENNMNLVSTLEQKLDRVTKGLSLRGTVSFASSYNYNRDLNRQTDNYPQYIYDVNSGSYTIRDNTVYRVRRFFINYDAGQARRAINIQAIMNYNRTFGSHHFYGLALFNQNSIIENNTTTPAFSYIPANSRGFSGRIGYDYKQKYLLELNAGYNGSDRFVGAKRYGLFPAISGGWNIAEEPFFKENIAFVDRLKFRASYGLVGSDKLPNGYAYSYAQTYSSGGGPSFGYADNTQSYAREGSLGNANVTWEKEKKLDIGMDIELLNHKLTGTFDYFNHNRYDILTTRGTVSAIFGQGLPPVNLGKSNNFGYEAELVYKDQVGKNFSYFVRANYSVARNKIVFKDEPQAKYPWQQATGKGIGMIQVYRWIGYYKDADDVAKSPSFASGNKPGDLKYADLNGDGIIDGYDMEYAGYPNLPNTSMGFNFGFTYKNFSFSVLLQSAINFNVRGVAEAVQAFGSNLQPLHQQAWTPELGDNAKYPRLSLQPGTNEPRAYPSTFWYISGNYLRLRNAEVSYKLPAAFLRKARLRDARIYANGNNLYTWSSVQKLYQFDPEINSGNDRTNYPPQRLVNLGISLGL